MIWMALFGLVVGVSLGTLGMIVLRDVLDAEEGEDEKEPAGGPTPPTSSASQGAPTPR